MNDLGTSMRWRIRRLRVALVLTAGIPLGPEAGPRVAVLRGPKRVPRHCGRGHALGRHRFAGTASA